MDAPRPIQEIPAEICRGLSSFFTDIDDTITEGGLLTAESFGALWDLHRSGLELVVVTGRPAGWCDHIARMWPVDAVVGENGAFYFTYDRQARRMNKVFTKDENQRREDRKRLDELREEILREVPGAGIASDQDYRVADLAIDFREDVPPLPDGEIARIVSLFEAAGASAKVSSIHVNGWFGSYDKLSMTERCLREVFHIDLHGENEALTFIGDSPNDCPMFSVFTNSVGVANVRDFDLPAPPAWVTHGRSSDGFCELAEALLKAKA